MKDEKNTEVPEFKLGKSIDSGNGGTVYELTGKDGKPINWVMKSSVSDDEKKITSQFYKTGMLNNNLIMEKLKGSHLCHLKFLYSLQVASLITHTLNQYHHDTPGRKAIIHNDLHSENILVEFNQECTRINSINIIDFGYSLFADNPNPDTLYPDSHAMAILPRPYTAIENRYRLPFGSASAGIKSEVYQIESRLFSFYFPYLTFPKIYGIDVEIFVNKFRGFMRKENYQERPGSDEVFLFFHTLFRLYSIFFENKSDDILITSYIAKLIIMTNRQWDDKIVFREEKSPTTSWGDFDFESENGIVVRNAIIKISQNTLLNGSIEHLIPAVSKKIGSGDEKGFISHLVDEFGLDLLVHIKGDLEQRRDIAILAISELLQQNKITKYEIVARLESLAVAGKIDFLYKRQDFYKISVFNHKWKGKPVSATWLRCMTMIQRYASPVVESNKNFS